MQREPLYNILSEKLWWEPDKIISGYFSLLDEYDEKMYATNPEWIPLANNANRDELCDSYTEEQIKTMCEIILQPHQRWQTLTDKVIRNEYNKSLRMTLSKRKARSDNSDYVIKQYILNKDLIIDSLLQHKDIIYNPVVLLNKSKIDQCECILKLDLGFVDRQEFINRETFPSSRLVKSLSIDIPKLKELWYPSITREDILDVDLRHYTTTTRLLIQNNQFNLLQQ